ncbi:MAG TPA: Rpn family recombination-promoting nuclease/putative transposase [Blastocatellia bacterium]|nr:Rpn family recombination-promoting nuclease/putative transposase [Blastocatellia bacterium]HMV85203.1 Rpn family recombination-promoting nuclease/putative transposase [Blastocatellia bacterium]HMX24591.1 Rpn family recombination-promoting nuclease/putative transposase [Blastocatellia bacterium]HMY72293.1 Rpn family recombination-promoting nuclease/putative transposase [Blastocatellia bacterium]HMZ22686.1 Rpn family recombination-promoting nuclease/putative transposase [Blastocatellia bacteri
MANSGKYLHPFTDWGFKRLFGSEVNKDLLIDFLNQLLPSHHQIQDLNFARNEQVGRNEYDRRAIFDLFCVSPSGERFIVEMQKAKQAYFKDRSVFYATFPISEQAPQGDWDYKLEPVYLVGILDFVFDEDKDDSRVMHCVQLKDQINRVFYDKLMFIYLEMPKFTKTEAELETLTDKWLYVLKHLPELTDRPAKLQERVFSRLFELAEIGKFNRTERALYEESLKVYRDLTNVIGTSFIEGKVEGIEEGKEIGRAEGVEIGRAEGVEIGERKKALETARKALRKNLSVDDIAEMTGLTEAEIEALRE